MSSVVDYRVTSGVAVLTVANPPVNALSHAVRSGFHEGVERAEADASVGAIVLAAAGATFPAGADIAEFGGPARRPLLPELCNRIEAAGKPVVAAIHGTALGGGFELALAAHGRVAHRKSRLGLPEVRLGIVPGAGGTQRVPRLAGAGPALDLMLSGDPIGAEHALALGLVDQITDDVPLEAAVSLAAAMAQGRVAVRRVSEINPVAADPDWLSAIAARRKAVAGSPLLAPAKVIDCVEAAYLLAFDAGMSFERAAFEDLVNGPQSAALRYAFFAERKAGKPPGLSDARPRDIESVGIVGAGLMGAGIAVACLDHGLPVTLVEKSIDALEAGVERVIDTYDRAVAKGRMTADARDARIARLAGRTDITALANSDLVIEAVVEDLSVKRDVFAALGRITPPGTILATNTSYLDVNDIAEASGRASDLIGLHFFSPAHIMRLLEVIPAEETARDVTATGFALARRLGKIAVRAGVTDGFIGNRILAAYRQAAELVLLDGASVEDIDAAMREFGFPLGPFQVSDLAGLDIAWARRQRLAPTRDPSARYVAVADRLCEAGRLGRKSGRGWYAYPTPDSRGAPDPEVAAILSEERVHAGVQPRAFTAAQIQRRCLVAMANEGARLLAEGIAARPSDIDVVMLHGFAFPRWRGGPMKWADLAGLLGVKKDLDRWTAEDPVFWKPAPQFAELIKNGKTFDSLNT